MRLRKLTLPALTLLALLSVAAYSMFHYVETTTAYFGPIAPQMPNGSFRFKPSLDTSERTFAIEGVPFRIPRNYLYSLTPSGEFSGFLVEANFPTFVGATEDTIQCFKPVGTPPCPEIIHIWSMGYGINTRTRSEIIAADPEREDTPAEFGLMRHHGSKMSWPEAYIVPDADELIYISCMDDTLPYRYCTSYVDIAGEFKLTYQFDYQHLKDWRAIHDGVGRLMTSFVVAK